PRQLAREMPVAGSDLAHPAPPDLPGEGAQERLRANEIDRPVRIDLADSLQLAAPQPRYRAVEGLRRGHAAIPALVPEQLLNAQSGPLSLLWRASNRRAARESEIGRASCRERG